MQPACEFSAACRNGPRFTCATCGRDICAVHAEPVRHLCAQYVALSERRLAELREDRKRVSANVVAIDAEIAIIQRHKDARVSG
jgi:hypothetical protein